MNFLSHLLTVVLIYYCFLKIFVNKNFSDYTNSNSSFFQPYLSKIALTVCFAIFSSRQQVIQDHLFMCKQNELSVTSKVSHCKNTKRKVPICENQEKNWQHLELIENFWKIPSFIERPDSTTIRLENSINSTSITTSVIKTPKCIRLVANSNLETAPVSSCPAPIKKGKL